MKKSKQLKELIQERSNTKEKIEDFKKVLRLIDKEIFKLESNPYIV